MSNKKYYLLILAIIVIFAPSCKKTNTYSFFRQYFPNSYMTKKGAEFLTTSPIDRNLTDEEGEKIESAYFALIEGEFENIGDSIIQYGHCWSTTNPNPYINPNDTSTYSNLGSYNGTDQTFVSSIPNLFPETPYYVRSYIITSQNDTGYNQSVFIDTTLAPIDEWFVSENVGQITGDGRSGAVAFTYKPEDVEYGIIGLGKDDFQYLKDMWQFDPVEETWSQLPNAPTGRADAIGFSITYENGQKQQVTKMYIGTGTNYNGVLKDFYEYDLFFNYWSETESNDKFPIEVQGAVAFVIGEKAYIGSGSTYGVALANFFVFNPVEADKEDGKSFVNTRLLGNDNSNARKNAVAFVIDDIGFVGLGENNDGEYFNDLWMYIPETGTSNAKWIKRQDLPAAPRTDAVGLSANKQGYVGLGFDGSSILKDFWRYDPYNNSWSQCADHKIGPDYINQIQPVRNAVGFGIDKKVYVGTGYFGEEYSPKYTKEFWIYRPW